jgi:competence protein ComGF
MSGALSQLPALIGTGASEIRSYKLSHIPKSSDIDLNVHSAVSGLTYHTMIYQASSHEIGIDNASDVISHINFFHNKWHDY